jgi:hypothetical protein
MEPPEDLAESDYTEPTSTRTTTSSSLIQSSLLDHHLVKPSEYLSELNPSQLEAVTAPLNGGTQLLAGPGSGKTKVLTCRVATLIQQERLEPERLV